MLVNLTRVNPSSFRMAGSIPALRGQLSLKFKVKLMHTHCSGVTVLSRCLAQ